MIQKSKGYENEVQDRNVLSQTTERGMSGIPKQLNRSFQKLFFILHG